VITIGADGAAQQDQYLVNFISMTDADGADAPSRGLFELILSG
jgi:hypothetical protein